MLAAVEKEILGTLGPLGEDQTAYPIYGLEASLTYTTACVRENFRINPVFTMPLWRRVNYPAGVGVGGYHIPHGVSFPFPSCSESEIITNYS